MFLFNYKYDVMTGSIFKLFQISGVSWGMGVR